MDWVQRMVCDAAGLRFWSNYNQDGARDECLKSYPTNVGPSSCYGGHPFDYVPRLADQFHDVVHAAEQLLWNGCTQAQLASVAELVDIKRLYASEAIAEQITWHTNHQTGVGSMCHPSDAKEWRHFGWTYLDFTVEPCNVRLGLCTDGFAPAGSTVNSKCLIDVYLELLIEELQNLWYVGIIMGDNGKNETFTAHTALMWIVNWCYMKLIPVAFREMLPEPVWTALTEVSHLLQILCSMMLDVYRVQELEASVATILCNLEKIFPPTFFNSMEHLIVHLFHKL
ncbi:hypothetical protein Sango_1263900 [Sesamum angolense]|uniref:DUF4218 domain-containing protein n=1 Tax=Sesamum angolense TaxID=2727404 RepID=A0AAE1WQW3_9LAMI|nr:hypothetical protein Sango_1263900 [Sesamum angolense]